MSHDPITLPSETRCSVALDLMREKGIRRIPIVHSGKITGIITERDLLRVLPGSVLQAATDPPVGQVQTRKIISLAPSDHLGEAARIMLRERIGGLMVMEEGKLVGMITESDVFRVFAGAHNIEEGQWILLRVKLSAEDELLRICLAGGARVLSLIRMPYGGRREQISMRVDCENFDELLARFANRGYLTIDSRDAA